MELGICLPSHWLGSGKTLLGSGKVKESLLKEEDLVKKNAVFDCVLQGSCVESVRYSEAGNLICMVFRGRAFGKS